MKGRGVAGVPEGMTYTLPDGIEGEIDLACGWLRAIGLYVRRTAPIDWDNASKAGRNPTLIRGGTHVDEGEFRVVHNPFFIEACDNPPGYQARYPGPPGQGPIFEEQHFERFSEAVGFILSKWTPLVEGRTPTRKCEACGKVAARLFKLGALDELRRPTGIGLCEDCRKSN